MAQALEQNESLSLVERGPGSEVYTHANSLLQSSWAKREIYEFVSLVSVKEVSNPVLRARYDTYIRELHATGCHQRQ